MRPRRQQGNAATAISANLSFLVLLVLLVTAPCYSVATPANLVLMTNVIRGANSVFNASTRFDHTLASVASVNLRIPLPYIVIVEGGSVITDDERERLYAAGAHVVMHVNVTGRAKSHGEALLLMHAFERLHRSRRRFTTVSKLSGRYTLTPDFKFDVAPVDTPVAIIDHPRKVVETRYWRIPWTAVDLFREKLHDIVGDSAVVNGEMDIEHAFYKNEMFPANTLSPRRLGVYGIMAAGDIMRE